VIGEDPNLEHHELYTVEELATRLRVSYSAALGLVQLGRIASISVGQGKIRHRYRIPAEAVEAFIHGGAREPAKVAAPVAFRRIV
jgi:excisionase family DNA binding protein